MFSILNKHIAFECQHKDTIRACMVAVYPVLLYTPNDKTRIEEIVNSFGLSIKRVPSYRRKKFDFTKPKECLDWIYKNVDEKLLAESKERYLESRPTSTTNTTQSSTHKILNSSSFDRWMRCVNDLNYDHVHAHYCCDSVMY